MNFIKRLSVLLSVILAFQVFGSVSAGAYAQPAEAKGVKNRKIAYITIDDGPSRNTTTANLDTLKKYGVKATFFVLPRNGVDDIYKRIVAEGHAIGNHSYSHDYNYLYNSIGNFKKDVIKAGNFIFEKTGYTPTVFRFPGGTMGRSKSVINERAGILGRLGYRYFDWDVSTADTDPNLRTYGNEAYIVNLLANNVLKNTKNRNKLIILMHDSSGKTYSVKALPLIIEGLRKQGYEFGVLTADGDWQYELNGKREAVITGYTGSGTIVTVPSILGGRTVTSINSGAFTDDPVTSISIPDCVVNIDSGAFRECGTLMAINFGKGNPRYKSVDGVAYSDGGKVLFHYPAGKIQPSDTFAVPQGVQTIGRCAFGHNPKLKKIILPNSVIRIEESAFCRCDELESFDIPSSVTEIGVSAFAGCNKLSTITVEAGNPSFNSVDGVLFDITGALLKQYPQGKIGGYTVPEGVTTIGESAFRGCNGLSNIRLGDSVSRIDSDAFAFCEGLKDAELGNGLISVGKTAFQRCAELKSIVVPQNLKTVEGMAFESCGSLTDIYFLGDMPEFGDNVFQNTYKEFSVNYLESLTGSWAGYTNYPSKPFSDIPYFNDVASGAWYNKAVNFIAARGIATGTGNGEFSPDAKLTRGQFIVLLMRAYGIEPDANPADNFADVGSTYYTGYIATAKRLGITDGTGNNLFAPENEITRQEMFTLLYNVLSVIGQLPQGDPVKSLSDFSDETEIGSWAKNAVTLLVQNGIITGNGGRLNPTGTATRAQMAQVLYNLLLMKDG